MRLPGVSLLLILALPGFAENQPQAAPLPDVATLMRDVDANQERLEKLRENYTYLERTATTELNKDGSPKKTETEDVEVSFVNGREIDRKVRKNGKELSASDQAKEQDRVLKQVQKAEKASPGKTADGDEISVSRMLQIMKYSTPRREMLDGRSTLVFDYTGDPRAKTHGMTENASKKLAGTVWIDERDRQVRKLTASFDGDFHLGFGLFTLLKGSSFVFEQKLVNNELWLPVSAHIHVVGKAIAFVSYRGEVQQEDSNYQRFHVEAQPAPVTKHGLP